jgi:hypothetical protein
LKTEEDRPVVSDDSTFRQNHDAMRAAATHPVRGPASTDTLAASGGLELRRAAREPSRPSVREPIPGERERDTLAVLQPGAVGGVGFGADLPAADSEATMDDRTAHEREIEGGGADSQRTHEHKKRV